MNDLGTVHQAIYTALNASPYTGKVYDAVPQGVAYPYIVIGAPSGLPDEELAAASSDVEWTLHGWTGGTSKAQGYAILAFFRSKLDNASIGGAWAFTEEFQTVFEDEASTAASRLYHAVARYRVRLG
jgi:hypothetical protein